MGKNASRKPRPSPPRWHWLEVDGCWFCKNKNACNGCKTLKAHKRRRDRQNDARHNEQLVDKTEVL